MLLAVLVAAGLTATAAPAQAATCSGPACTYQNPESTGCSADAVTVAHVQLPAVQQRLELRWSPRCQSNWARMYLDTDPTWLRAIQPDRGDGLPRVTQLIGRNSTYSWSAMIYSPTRCVYADVQTRIWGWYRTACV
ncbi:DUF2690 domain-containing protein [Virgisporangium aurantiacum]|uniref:DUF2690 domain-containing protein n=1 Tax=Virgisporangium aurantiacum TaxID=175570 RepID=A0A8J4E2K6_9ACTN|nr:DUF2690 domain-containing protein [Virgisporangium aurantiacum]GIJ57132.1 hypothetical protein Vau01_046480 [Virgisporangium aurantiacum]